MASRSEERHDVMLAIMLQLDELDLQKDGRKGKHKFNQPPDFDVATDHFAAQLDILKTEIQDEGLAVSIAKACAADAAAITEILEAERADQTNRTAALRLGGGQVADCNSRGGVVDQYECWERSSLKPGEFDFEDSEPEGESSSTYSKRQQKAAQYFAAKKVECSSCNEMVLETNSIECPCTHIYCKICLTSLIMRSIKDESLYPPRCCRQPVQQDTIERLLDSPALEIFREAQIEYSTIDRIYCPNRTCGRFIPPRKHGGSDTVQCNHCSAKVCRQCKNDLHGGDCPQDEALQAVLSMGREESWRRCFNCRTMIELNQGCNHITCKCSAEFCYVCGVEWKQCACDAWDENNLVRRAEGVVARERARPNQAGYQNRVQNVMQEIRENHECDHHGKWERREYYRRKGYRCEMCGDRHWKFILVCRHCHLMACQMCRSHRI